VHKELNAGDLITTPMMGERLILEDELLASTDIPAACPCVKRMLSGEPQSRQISVTRTDHIDRASPVCLCNRTPRSDMQSQLPDRVDDGRRRLRHVVGHDSQHGESERGYS
jgi:hypothetical protein